MSKNWHCDLLNDEFTLKIWPCRHPPFFTFRPPEGGKTCPIYSGLQSALVPVHIPTHLYLLRPEESAGMWWILTWISSLPLSISWAVGAQRSGPIPKPQGSITHIATTGQGIFRPRQLFLMRLPIGQKLRSEGPVLYGLPRPWLN